MCLNGVTRESDCALVTEEETCDIPTECDDDTPPLAVVQSILRVPSSPVNANAFNDDYGPPHCSKNEGMQHQMGTPTKTQDGPDTWYLIQNAYVIFGRGMPPRQAAGRQAGRGRHTPVGEGKSCSTQSALNSVSS